MPTYEYECPRCKASYDLRQGFDAETTHACEECGKGVAKRILHAPRLVFKGSGWYATDSRKSQSAVSESSESATNAADSGDARDAPAKEPATRSSAPKESTARPAASNDAGASSEAAAAG